MIIVIFFVFTVLFVVERFFPASKLPDIATWVLRAILLNGIQLAIILIAGMSWERWLTGISLFKLSESIHPFFGGLISYFFATFVFYWWHRFRHTVDFLWVHFHQVHHSPQRIEVSTALYKHPTEMLANSLIGSLIVYMLFGFNLEAGEVYTGFTIVAEFFYHSNIKTARWIGYVFQRPEMHRIHHESNKHRNNYGDFVWWDMLFGTYENPTEFQASCGFEEEEEQRLFDMLQFIDVHKESGEQVRMKAKMKTKSKSKISFKFRMPDFEAIKDKFRMPNFDFIKNLIRKFKK